MNLKQAIRKERQGEDTDVNIIPVMNIFLILIPFLLLTAVFVKIAIIDLSLPSLNKKEGIETQIQSQNLVLIILAVKEDGFQLKSPGFKFPKIEKIAGEYNYKELVNELRELKNKHQQAEDIIISPEANVKYDIIIKVMDRCRESGFSNISLSG